MIKQKISVIIPTYNEGYNINLIANKLFKILNKYSYDIIFIDDGSYDDTLIRIKKLTKNYKQVKYVSFSRNFGHQNALKAGFDLADGDCVVSMDCDMQHPPELIPKMIKLWKNGADVVNMVAINKNINFWKKTTSSFFYKFINLISDTEIKSNVADFRLLDKKVVKVINKIDESPVFLRGLISWCGFKQEYITYVPNKRIYGDTKYSLKKMLSLALDGVTSFSVKPLQISTIFGFILSFVSGIYALYAFVAYLLNKTSISGWTSMIITLLFLGGMQLIMLGILGEYLGKLFIESKKRPKYIISSSNIKKSKKI